MGKFDGKFKDWEMENYTIGNSDYCLWTANGFLFFYDYYPYYRKVKPFLKSFSFFDRYRIWREYRREYLRRCKQKREEIKRKLK